MFRGRRRPRVLCLTACVSLTPALPRHLGQPGVCWGSSRTCCQHKRSLLPHPASHSGHLRDLAVRSHMVPAQPASLCSPSQLQPCRPSFQSPVPSLFSSEGLWMCLSLASKAITSMSFSLYLLRVLFCDTCHHHLPVASW